MRKNRIWKAIIAMALVGTACFGALSGLSAYFTDSDEKINTVTVGNVKTDLEEPGWEDVPEDDKQDITPNEMIQKDPEITNTGKNDAFVFAEVHIPVKNIVCVGEDGQKLPAAETELFSYEIQEGWTKIKEEDVGGNDEEKFRKYVYAYGSETECMMLKPGETTPPLFTDITLVNAVEGQIDDATLEIPVKSYAIQAENAGDSKLPEDIYDMYMKQNQEG